jgi:hypothetical protein
MNDEVKSATCIVHWPGKDAPSCDIHKLRLVNLGAHMGFSVAWSELVAELSGIPCVNCENEAKKAGK